MPRINAPLNVREVDGSPSTYPYQLQFPNGSLTDNGDGTTTVEFISASSSGVTSLNSQTGAITLQGTSNQVTVGTSGTTITLSTPQNTHTSATPQFARLGLGVAADSTFVLKTRSGSSGNGVRIDGPDAVNGTQVIQFGYTSGFSGQIRSTTIGGGGGGIQILPASNGTTQTASATFAANGDVAIGGSAAPSQNVHIQNHSLFSFTQTLGAYAVQVKPTWNNAGAAFSGLVVDTTDTASLTTSRPFVVKNGGSDLFNIYKTGTFEVYTGASATGGVGFQVLSTWNAASSYVAFRLNITDTASGSSSKAFSIVKSSSTLIDIYKQGTIDHYTAADAIGGTSYQINATWNNAGVGYKGMYVAVTNTASAASSYLYLGTVGGATKFYVDKAGKGYFDNEIQVIGSINHDGSNVGFYGVSPTARATTSGAASTFAANTSGIANDTATWDGYTIGQVVKALRNIGILT